MKELTAFQVAEIPRGGFVSRLLGGVSKEAVFVQIRNLLATTPFERVRESDVATILASGKLLPRQVATDLIGIFEQAVHILAADHELTGSDRHGLAGLQRAFELTDAEAAVAIEQAVGAIYERALREALADGEFTPAERTRLERMAETARTRALGAGSTL